MPESSNGTSYDLVGNPGNPLVVLIHGLGVNRNMWQEFSSGLSHNYRVLSYDLFGHGESPIPSERPSLKLFSDQLAGLLGELELKASSIIGFSLGGMINRRFAMDYPDLVQSLAILNSPHERSPEQQRMVEERVRDTSQGGPEATIETSLARWFTPEFRSVQAATVEEVRTWILDNDPLWYTQCREVLAFGVLELIRPQPPIEHPTLVITCEHDSGSTPQMSHGIGREIKHASVIIVPKLQHLGLMESCKLFVEPIESFLSRVLTSKS